MDLRQLRYFVALNEHRSFVRAADAMGITQPAFSRSIQALEQKLGCALVDRGSKELRPTPEGQVVLQHALSLVRGANNLAHEIRQMTKLDAGQLRLGCDPVAAADLLPKALLALAERYPNIQVQVEISEWAQLSRHLGRDELDFFIADPRHAPADPQLQQQPLKSRAGQFFCRREHPLLSKESISTNDIFDYPLAAPKLPSSARAALARLSGKDDLTLHWQSEHLPLLTELVRNSDAIGFAPLAFLRPYLEQSGWQTLQCRNIAERDEALQWPCALITRTGFRLSHAANMALQLVQQLDADG